MQSRKILEKKKKERREEEDEREKDWETYKATETNYTSNKAVLKEK